MPSKNFSSARDERDADASFGIVPAELDGVLARWSGFGNGEDFPVDDDVTLAPRGDREGVVEGRAIEGGGFDAVAVDDMDKEPGASGERLLDAPVEGDESAKTRANGARRKSNGGEGNAGAELRVGKAMNVRREMILDRIGRRIGRADNEPGDEEGAEDVESEHRAEEAPEQ